MGISESCTYCYYNFIDEVKIQRVYGIYGIYGLSNKLQLKSLHKGSSVKRGDYEISTH